ncbi:hypothetical protein V8F33_011547 [Rhypophila sp. PSN 637]
MTSTAGEQSTGHLREGSPSPSPRSRSRSASVSLQAAATLNAGLQRGDSIPRSSNFPQARQQQPSPSAGRRRSQVLMNLQMADPNIPAPGEMIGEPHIPLSGLSATASPHRVSASPQPLYSGEPQHFRTPSLGEIHQELENEQEFQVNRLLAEIRRLQQQLQRQQSSAISDEAASDRSTPLHVAIPGSGPHSAHPTTASGSVPRSPGFPHPRSSFDMARVDLQRRSRTPSRGASPRLRSSSISAESGEPFVLGGRDESAIYQAETQMLTRENQMLRHRIRELERQMSESGSGSTHEPSHASRLHRSTSISEPESSRPIPPHLEPVPDVPKEEDEAKD